jgi:hypothetical protein
MPGRRRRDGCDLRLCAHPDGCNVNVRLELRSDDADPYRPRLCHARPL